jgi:hypothetical protein
MGARVPQALQKPMLAACRICFFFGYVPCRGSCLGLRLACFHEQFSCCNVFPSICILLRCHHAVNIMHSGYMKAGPPTEAEGFRSILVSYSCELIKSADWL